MNENDWRDERPIAELNFGQELQPKIVEVMKSHPWPESAFTWSPPEKVPDDFDVEKARATALERWKLVMRDIPTEEAKAVWSLTHHKSLMRIYTLLAECGVTIAEDIKQLGCTGCSVHGLSLDDIKFLRLGIAGGGVGLPCFVPPERYCLAHETTGGLQAGQAQRYAGQVAAISREATPQERSHDALVSEARYAERERDAHGMLHGKALPEDWLENVDAIRREGGIDEIVEAGRMAAPRASWKCPEHDKTTWTCRYCVAQAIVEGDLVPTFRLFLPMNESLAATPAEEIDNRIAALNTMGSGMDKVSIYVEAARYTRKLARD